MINLDDYYPLLQKYLSLHSIETQFGVNCKCPIKNHKSRAPFIINHGEGGRSVWYCHACGLGGSIFELASYLYQLPFLKESGFYSITLQHLSDFLGIEMPVINQKPLTSLEQEKNQLYSATRDICNNISISNQASKYATSRGWNTDILKKFGIGVLSDFKKLKINLQSKYSNKTLQSVGIVSKGYYKTFLEEDRLLFPIHDNLGRPVGFTGRLLNYKPGTPRKYVNTSSSLIFKKSNILYNLHRVLHGTKKNKDNLLYLVEGQADVVTLYQAGLTNVVAISGVAFTDFHLKLISKFDNIVACLDADDGGFVAAQKLYKKYKHFTKKDLFLIKLPEFKDPDEFVINRGLEVFQKLPTFLPIEWEIYNSNIHNEVAAEHWLRKLLDENAIYYDRILKTLSKKTNISIDNLNLRLSQLSIEYLLTKMTSVDTDEFNLNIRLTKERM